MNASAHEFLVEGREVRKRFRVRRAFGGGHVDVNAVNGVSFAVARGGALGIVGESGSGKTTIARMIVGLERPTSGMILIDGAPLSPSQSKAERLRRSRL